MMLFFKNTPGALNFAPYHIYHLLAIFIMVFLAFMIFIYRKKLMSHSIDRNVRISASIAAFVLEVGFHISNLVYHTYFFFNLIPLDLCTLSFWIALSLNIRKNKLLFNILYFWGIGGVASFVYPDIHGFGPDRWRYYHFFGVHGYIILTVVYFTIVHGYRIKFNSFLQAVGVLLPLTFIVHYIDLRFYAEYQTNWMYLVSPPDIHTILDTLPQGGWPYYFAFVLIGVFVFFIAYVPWGVYGKIKRGLL